ncbi:MAG: sigma-54 dependent transcriptional regulator [Ignavibacteria bacterium]|nr:sigma-54 dependent transcriptional regulator [Ignavibacteria bacterium]
MKDLPKILIADDDETFCYVLKEQLLESNFEVAIALNGQKLIELTRKSVFDIVFLDLQMPGTPGMELLTQLSAEYPALPIIILTGENEAKKAVECIRRGAYDYVVKPYDFEELLVLIGRALEHKELKIRSSVLDTLAEAQGNNSIVGSSPALQQMLALAGKAAKSASNILIQGETGTGKELMAEFIHKNSPRASRPFVVINCASLPDQLIESELFGYEKGAFTDAKNSKQGLVEIANGGTLFLDEIGELSLALQPKLLRFLENGEFRRIGGLSNIHSDVRVISATNRDLMNEADSKNFRRDLLFRLNVITLEIPPLRDRREDIIELANHFITKKSPIRSRKVLAEEAKQILNGYQFPGNVRELEHIIERAMIFSEEGVINAKDLFISNTQGQTIPPQQVNESGSVPIHTTVLVKTIDEIEMEHIQSTLKEFGWDQTKTAATLGISQKTLYNKIKKYNLKEGY